MLEANVDYAVINNTGSTCYGTITDGGYNLSSDDTCGFTAMGSANNVNNLNLGTLANNGGPTQTIALMGGSAALNRVPAANCPATDQRGYARLGYDTSCDVGAVEGVQLGNGTAATCQEANLNAALQAGGSIFVNCPPNTTITVTSNPNTSSNYRQINQTVILDASYSTNFSISGNSQYRLFEVNYGKSLTINGLTLIKGKVISNDGGAIYNDIGGTLTVANSTFNSNSASNIGGAIFNNGALSVSNSTFSSNSANYGGAIYNLNGNISNLSNSTFSSNSANYGGAIGNGYGTVNLKSSVLAKGSNGGNCFTYGSGTIITDGGFNLSDDSTCNFTVGTSSIANRNPDLDTLKNNGGPTQTILPKQGSPAIDAIPAANCGATTDQRGVARPQNGKCDIGAVEVKVGDTTSTGYKYEAPSVANGVNTGGGSSTSGSIAAKYAAYLHHNQQQAGSSNANGQAKPNAAATSINYTTYLSIENKGNGPATITVTYYSTAGAVLATDTNHGQTIAPHTVYNAPQMLGAGQTGSAIVSSDEPVSVLISSADSQGSALSANSYIAIDLDNAQPSTIYAPIALNNAYGGFGTAFVVDNLGSTPVTATVTYYNNVGSAVVTQTVQLGANAETLLDQTAVSAHLPTGFAGWAAISNAQGQPMTGQVLETNPNTGFFELVNMTGDTSSTVYIPVVFQGAFGNFNTGMQLVNPNPVTATVSVTYYRQDGTRISNVINGDGAFTLPPHGSTAFYHGSGFPELNTPNGGFVGAAIVSSDQPLLGLVNQSGSVNGVNYNGTFAALYTSSSEVNLPEVFKNSYGFTTGLQVVNLSEVASTATLTYYDTTGNQVYQTTLTGPDGKAIVAGGIVDVYLGSESHLPTSFAGSIVLSADNGETGFVVVANNASNQVFFTYASNN